MRKSFLIAVASAAWSVGAPALAQSANPADDATKFITTVIDKFNSGDVKAWIAAQNDNTMIVDEFGPHVWSGSGSPQRWLDAYAKDSAASGVTNPRVDYGRPLQATSDGKTAYVVLPTTYRFVQKGAKMAEPSSMTFVLNRDGNGWKIVSWTYSATAAPAPDK
jgi:hypothetical protein